MADPGAAAEAISVAFSEAIEYLRRLLAIGTDEWLRILAEEGVVSTAIADDTVRAVTQDLAAAVLEAIESGTSLDDFRRDYAQIVRSRGWRYKGGDQDAWHSELIFRLHTGNAYAAGRWEQAQRLEEARPGMIYARLVTAGDNRVRHTHREMQGIIRPIGDAYWRTHWPPNGFNCRCHAMIVTDRDLRRYHWTVTPDGDPRLKVPPDPGWAFNPGAAGERLRQIEAAD